MPSLTLAARRLRNRMIADPVMRGRMASWPLLSRLTRRRSADLFDLLAGFAYSQGLAALLRSGVLEWLEHGDASLDELHSSLDLTERALTALLTVATSLGLVRRIGARYALDDLGVVLLQEPGVRAMVEHHALVYEDLADALPLLSEPTTASRTAQFWQYAGGRAGGGTTPEGARRYSELMAVTQDFVSREVVSSYPFRRHRHLVDVGGGAGAFAMAVARSCPTIRTTTFDLPDVVPLARASFEEHGLDDRCDAVGGSFLDRSIPDHGDLYSLVRVLYDHDDHVVEAILANLHARMPDGATLLVAEPMAGQAGAERVGAYFAMYLAAMGSGRCRSASELAGMIEKAGFARVRERRVGNPVFTGLLSAVRA